jgi:DNA-directed RNA polymerase subunit RPC12/RpoP
MRVVLSFIIRKNDGHLAVSGAMGTALTGRTRPEMARRRQRRGGPTENVTQQTGVACLVCGRKVVVRARSLRRYSSEAHRKRIARSPAPEAARISSSPPGGGE